jgi:hypothetical protein
MSKHAEELPINSYKLDLMHAAEVLLCPFLVALVIVAIGFLTWLLGISL